MLNVIIYSLPLMTFICFFVIVAAIKRDLREHELEDKRAQDTADAYIAAELEQIHLEKSINSATNQFMNP